MSSVLKRRHRWASAYLAAMCRYRQMPVRTPQPCAMIGRCTSFYYTPPGSSGCVPPNTLNGVL